MSDEALTIRPATEGDIPVLNRLAGEIWRACYPAIIPLEQIEYMLEWMYAPEVIRQELRSGHAWDLLLFRAEAAGYCAYVLEPAGQRIKLNKLYLRPELHGRGLGQQALRHVAARAAVLGARQVYLTVNKRNTGALRAYQRAGYRVAKSVVNDIGRGFVMDDFVMTFDLAGP